MHLTETERTWNWLDDGVLPYLLAGMRAVWIWLLLRAWAHGMTPPRAELLSPFHVFALLALSTLFAQIAAFRWRDARGAWLVVLGGITAVALSVYAAFGFAPFQDLGALLGVVLVAAWCWRWGILAGREPLTYDTFARNFLYGIAALALAGFVTFTAHVLTPGELILPILFFFAFGLGALALASLRDAQQYERAKHGAAFALNRYWLVTVGIVIVGLLASGLLLGGAFAPEWGQRVIAAVLFVWHAVTAVVLTIVLAIALVFFGVLNALGRVLRFTSGSAPPLQIQVPRLDELVPEQQNAPVGIPPEWYLLAQIVSALLLTLLLAALFALALRRFRNYAQEDAAETRDSVFSMDLLQAQLRKLFRRDAEKQSVVAPYAEIRGDDARAQIRKIYQEFLAWADAQGAPRRPGQTPYELQRLLETELHVPHAPLARLTTAYVNARYDASSLTPQEAQQAQEAWQNILKSGLARTNIARPE